MKRWNGWGEKNIDYKLPETAIDFIHHKLGKAKPTKDISLPDFAQKVPDSRLNKNALFTTEKEVRVQHSFGQSFPDWVAMKSGKIDQFPDAVAFPESNEQVQALIALSKENHINLIPFGGGSSVVGHLKVLESERPVITVSMRKMDKRLSLDQESQVAVFQAGILGPELEASLNKDGFTLGHYPQSFEFSTVGGWVASRSSGQFSLNYGRIERLFAGGTIETPAGSVKLPVFPASSAGPDIKEMILGSEGRLGIITECALNISRLPEYQQFNGAFFPDAESAMSAVKEVSRSKIPLAMVRLSFAEETETMLSLNGKNWLIDVLDRYLAFKKIRQGEKCMMLYGSIGSKRKVRNDLKIMGRIIKKWKGADVGAHPGEKWAEKRFKLPYLRNTLWEMGYGIDTVETATTWENIPNMVSELEAVIKNATPVKEEIAHVFTHLSHVYPQGSSVYTTYIFKLAETPEDNIRRWEAMKNAASNAIVKNNGTISHQHGVGLDHKPYLKVEKSENGLRLLQSIFKEMDPEFYMNPGKLVDE